MTSLEQKVRVAASSAAAFAGALFVVGYHYIQYHNNVEHMHRELPQATRWLAVAVPWAMLVPVVILALGMAWIKRSLAVTVTMSAAWLFALAWPLVCIWAWEVPTIMM